MTPSHCQIQTTMMNCYHRHLFVVSYRWKIHRHPLTRWNETKRYHRPLALCPPEMTSASQRWSDGNVPARPLQLLAWFVFYQSMQAIEPQ